MRLTTKIIIGIIGSIFILSLLFIIGFSFSERKYYTFSNRGFNEINIPQEKSMGIDIAPFHVVVLEEDRTGIVTEEEVSGIIQIYLSYSGNNSLTLNPITSGDENRLFIPEALNGFIVAKTNSDTLTIQIKADELSKKYKKNLEKEFLSFSGIHLTLYSSNVNIISKIRGFKTNVCDIETDSIKIDANGDILIESCKAIDIDPVWVSNCKLTVQNSMAKTISLDFDRKGTWSIEECEIEARNYSGSGRHNITLHKNETGTINWLPKNKDAELNIKVPGDTAQIVFR